MRRKPFPRVALALALLAACLAPRAAIAERPDLTAARRPMPLARSIGFDGAVLRDEVTATPVPHSALRPAPLPDRDLADPSGATLAAAGDASLTPGLFNPQSHFAGDGYAAGSSIDTDHNHRHSTGGGMNLSIPVQ